MARTPQNTADADVMAIIRQELTDFDAKIYQSYSSQTNNLQPLIDRLQSQEAQLGTVTIA